MAASVNITNEATPALARVTQTLRRDLGKNIGIGVVQLFQDNFRRQPKNKNNWPSTGFFADAARATNYDLLADAVVINVDQVGVRQRLEGGEIHREDGGYLTIPARAEAYGHRAREFSNLEAVFFNTPHGFFAALAASDGGARRKSFSGGEDKKVGGKSDQGDGVYYWLVKSVFQHPNPNVIPSVFEIAATCYSTVNGIVDRAMKKGGDVAL